MTPADWFPGVRLLGRFDWVGTGCWLLHHNGEAAVLEMPPPGRGEPSPADVAAEAAAGLRVKFLLGTHAHQDHFSRDTFRRLRQRFPAATPVLHPGFGVSDAWRADDDVWLDVGGEPLVLVPAAKHSRTDTLVMWRGTCCTGDWELGTLAGCHDGTRWGVPDGEKRAGVGKMVGWCDRHNYRVNAVYSAHANDKRAGIDFPALMRRTLT